MHFPGKPELASCALYSKSPIILIKIILTGQAEILHTHSILWAVSCPLTFTAMARSFEVEVDQM